ncbi:MAG: response regulator [Verrucomicrobiota bacterium]|jgi:DNA-binding response OmpR family regulator
MMRCAPILLAEDEESDVEIFRLALKRAALFSELIVARDGQEVVDYFNAESTGRDGVARPMPGLLLLDLKMPRMSGFEVLAWLSTQPRLNNVPVLILSSSNHESDIQKALKMGAREYFVKPGGMGDLVRILQDIHARYLATG